MNLHNPRRFSATFLISFILILVCTNIKPSMAYDMMTIKEYSTFISQAEKLNHMELSKEDALIGLQIKVQNQQNFRLGWIEQLDSQFFYFRELSGQQMIYRREDIKQYGKVEINKDLPFLLLNYSLRTFSESLFQSTREKTLMQNTLLALWLHHSNENEMAMEIASQIIESGRTYQKLKQGFASLYFGQMLEAYASNRDYDETKRIASYLLDTCFNSFSCQRTAKQLKEQLEVRTRDFVSLILPSTKEWLAFKTDLSKDEQLRYLAERIHLLNAIPNPKIKGLWLDGPQTSIPLRDISIGSNDSSFHKLIYNFQVINPYWEILHMNLQFTDAKWLIPLLEDSSFIPSIARVKSDSSYFMVMRYNTLISGIIHILTGRSILESKRYQLANASERKLLLNQFEKWIDENQNKSPLERNRDMLVNSTDWGDFNNARMMATDLHDTFSISILKKSYSRFNQPTDSLHQSLIVKSVYKIGSKSDLDSMNLWNQTTKNDMVRFWSALLARAYELRSAWLAHACGVCSYSTSLSIDLFSKVQTPLR